MVHLPAWWLRVARRYRRTHLLRREKQKLRAVALRLKRDGAPDHAYVVVPHE